MRFKFIILAGLVSVCLAACSSGVRAQVFGNPDGADRYLIVLEPTEHKLQVARQLVTRLDNGRSSITLVGIDTLKRTVPDGYRAVFLLNTGKAGQPDRRVMEFVKKHGDTGVLVVYTTWGREGTSPVLPVDSLSSASVDGNISLAVDELVRMAE